MELKARLRESAAEHKGDTDRIGQKEDQISDLRSQISDLRSQVEQQTASLTWAQGQIERAGKAGRSGDEPTTV